MSPDHLPRPDSSTPPDSIGTRPDDAPPDGDRPGFATHHDLGRTRQRVRSAHRRSLAAAARVLTWLRAAFGTAGSGGSLHRVRPRMRALQLGSAALAVGVLGVLVGGIDAAPQRAEVDLASARQPLSARSAAAEPVATWAEQASATTGVPSQALHAYVEAARELREARPGCALPWNVLAGIGRVESDHARFGGAVLLDSGRPSEPIIGVPLDGSGVQAVTDTDGGELDKDTVHDRAVGPMQFIPTTWQAWSLDGNGDGVTDPQNLYDAAATAGNYLCGTVQGGGLDVRANQREALMAYNQSAAYGSEVLSYARRYAEVDPPPTLAE